MLSPHDRASLFEALRPPEGYLLDAAAGTSFTLDLEAMLTAPIAFALYAAADSDVEEADVEPVGLLEAIRRHADRITIFCQSGQIAVPARRRTVFAWLEDAVVEVVAPRPQGLFHPKVWLVRYRHPGTDARVLRVLCATRNLTFDTSWDTLLRVESEPYDPPPAGSTLPAQTELAGLFRRLPDLAHHAPNDERRDAIEALADDLERIPLVPPDPFSALTFHVLGLEGGRADPFPAVSRKGAVISPFLGEAFLAGLAAHHPLALLVSREESLDRLSPQVLSNVDRVTALTSAIDVSPAEADGGQATSSTADGAGDPARLLAGLHAKLYLFDAPGGARMFTGSANATTAAFGGNVEVLAELEGPVEIGVDALLAETEGETGFAELLVDYRPLDETVEPTDAEQLELRLDVLRRQVADARLTATLTSDADDYLLRLSSDEPLPTLDADEAELTVWPVTLDEASSAQPLILGAPADVSFGVTLEGITSFFAVRATGRRGEANGATTFLVNARLEGAPEDRHSRLLAAMLRDPDRLLRYLLMLLHDQDSILGGEMGQGKGWLGRWVGAGWGELPLLELLLRALDRHPERLDHIERLLHDLADERQRILPEGFETVWDPIWSQRREGRR